MSMSSPSRLLAALALAGVCSTSALAQVALPTIRTTQALRPLPAEALDNGNPYDPSLGSDVAMGDNLALTSMPAYGPQGLPGPAGRVVVWTRNTDGSWQRTGTIDAPPGVVGLGEGMAVSTWTAFIGSAGGPVHVFQRSGNTWSVQQTIAPNGSMGLRDLAYDQGWLIVSHLGEPDVNIFARRNGTWTPVQVLAAGQSTADLFGWSVAIERATLVVGAPGTNQSRGAVYIFKLASGVWQQRQVITVPNGMPGDRFGTSVAVGGNGLIVVGAPGADARPAPTCGTSGASGAAYAYVPSGASWVIRHMLSHRFADCHIGFGEEVAINATHLAVKSRTIFADYRSKSVLYRRTSSGAYSVVGRDRGHDFSSLAMSPTTMMVGAPLDVQFGGVVNVHELSSVAP